MGVALAPHISYMFVMTEMLFRTLILKHWTLIFMISNIFSEYVKFLSYFIFILVIYLFCNVSAYSACRLIGASSGWLQAVSGVGRTFK